MQIGFNNDVEFEGVRYHIQTEDHGLKDGRITSQIFLSGAIIDTVTISYSQAIESITSPEDRDAEIRRRMRTIHKHCYKNIVSHKYGAQTDLPTEPSVSTPPQDDVAAEQSQLSQPVEQTTADDDAPTLTMQALPGGLAAAHVVQEEEPPPAPAEEPPAPVEEPPPVTVAEPPSVVAAEPVDPSSDAPAVAAADREDEDEGDTQPEPTTPPPALPPAGVLRSVGGNRRAVRVVYNNRVSAFRGFDGPPEPELAEILARWATPSS